MKLSHFQKRTLCVLVGAALVAGAQAQETKGEGSGPPFNGTLGCSAIPDNTYLGPNAGTTGMTCLTVPGQAGGTIGAMTVTVEANHTWVGDLTFKVIPPGGTPEVTLLNRPGRTGSGFGNSADMSAAFPINFASANPTDAEQMGTGLVSADVVCDADGLCTYFPNRDEETNSAATHLDAFTGMSAEGDWQFCAGDSAGGDLGEICGVTFDFDLQGEPLPEAQPVPVAGRWGLLTMLLAIGALGFAALRGRSN